MIFKVLWFKIKHFFFFYFKYSKSLQESDESKIQHTFSLVVMHWHRQSMLIRALNAISHLKHIGEIIVADNSNNLSAKDLKNKNKITVIPTGNLHQEYGLFTRYITVKKHAKFEHIIFMDDDMLVSPFAIQKLMLNYQLEPNIIHGVWGRNRQGFCYSTRRVDGPCDMVITALNLIKKENVLYALEHYNKLYSFFKSQIPNGNGEDIFLSLLVGYKTKQKHMAYSYLRHWALGQDDRGICKGKTHKENRHRAVKASLDLIQKL